MEVACVLDHWEKAIWESQGPGVGALDFLRVRNKHM